MRNKDLKIMLKYAKFIWLAFMFTFILRVIFLIIIENSEIYFFTVKISNAFLQNAVVTTVFIGVSLILNLNFKKYEKPQRND